MPEINDALKLAELAARAAGKKILEMQGGTSVTEKANSNLVTEADLAAQELIISSIKEQYPDYSIIAEENDLQANINAPHLWIIDPLDGTNNFAHHIPQFCVSIAYAGYGKVEAGVVFDPSRNELFSAVRGRGAFLNNKSIQVSKAASLQQAMVATGFYYDRGAMMRKTLDSIEKLFAKDIHGIRRYGAAALDLCWVACGRFDAYFEYHLSTWDFAAGILIVAEAGGFCTDPAGEPFTLESKGVIASNGKLHSSFSEIVKWRGEV